MKATPIHDFFAQDGHIREDGRMVHDMYLFELKKPVGIERRMGPLQDDRESPRRRGVPADVRRRMPVHQEIAHGEEPIRREFCGTFRGTWRHHAISRSCGARRIRKHLVATAIALGLSAIGHRRPQFGRRRRARLFLFCATMPTTRARSRTVSARSPARGSSSRTARPTFSPIRATAPPGGGYAACSRPATGARRKANATSRSPIFWNGPKGFR